jgi:hypothetical protein
MRVTTAYWPIPFLGGKASDRLTSNLSAQLNRLWHGILAHLDVSDEPRVWPSSHQTAEPPTWNSYDPVTGRSIYTVSESELRTWLEDLHYQDERAVRHYREQLRFMGHH